MLKTKFIFVNLHLCTFLNYWSCLLIDCACGFPVDKDGTVFFEAAAHLLFKFNSFHNWFLMTSTYKQSLVIMLDALCLRKRLRYYPSHPLLFKKHNLSSTSWKPNRPTLQYRKWKWCCIYGENFYYHSIHSTNCVDYHSICILQFCKSTLDEMLDTWSSKFCGWQENPDPHTCCVNHLKGFCSWS